MRILGADYVESDGILSYSIMDVNRDSRNYIETDTYKNIKSRYQAATELNRLYEKYNCTKVIVEDDLIEYLKTIYKEDNMHKITPDKLELNIGINDGLTEKKE